MATETGRACTPEDAMRLLDHLRVIETEEERASLMAEIRHRQQPMVVAFLNQHGFNLAYENAAFRQALMAADILLVDGVGLELALKILGRRPGLNMNGTDLIPKLIADSAGQSVALFGTEEPWLSRACASLAASGLKVTGSVDGFQEEAAYLAAPAAPDAQIVLLAMGMPKQELLSVKLAAAARGAGLIVNGGAIADYLGDRFTRAPGWVRLLRLEWMFRLVREPKRLATRYIVGGRIFVERIVALRAYARAQGR